MRSSLSTHANPHRPLTRRPDVIEARIRSGELLPDRPIPSENQMVQEFGVARGTARKALELLRERGLVVTVVGRGTFVARQTQ
ncbi:GntR family transcriptional regulator [Actinoplanes sp. NPDC000266]